MTYKVCLDKFKKVGIDSNEDETIRMKQNQIQSFRVNIQTSSKKYTNETNTNETSHRKLKDLYKLELAFFLINLVAKQFKIVSTEIYPNYT